MFSQFFCDRLLKQFAMMQVTETLCQHLESAGQQNKKEEEGEEETEGKRRDWWERSGK